MSRQREQYPSLIFTIFSPFLVYPNNSLSPTIFLPSWSQCIHISSSTVLFQVIEPPCVSYSHRLFHLPLEYLHCHLFSAQNQNSLPKTQWNISVTPRPSEICWQLAFLLLSCLILQASLCHLLLSLTMFSCLVFCVCCFLCLRASFLVSFLGINMTQASGLSLGIWSLRNLRWFIFRMLGII